MSNLIPCNQKHLTRKDFVKGSYQKSSLFMSCNINLLILSGHGFPCSFVEMNCHAL